MAGKSSTKINEQYFSGSQASLFIGDVWVDDIFGLDYNVQQNKTPIYGYGSQYFDFIAKGQMLISGSFSINFREPSYLWMILERYKRFNKSAEERLKDLKDQQNKESAQTYEADKRQRFDAFFQTGDPALAKNNLLQQSREFNNISEDNSKENFNHGSFDILLGYGHELNENSPGETIQQIQIIGKSKIINSDGRPIAEQYSFIGRKLV